MRRSFTKSYYRQILAIFFLAFTGCQNYSTGLQQSQARAEETAAIAALQTVGVAQRAYAMMNDGQFGTFEQLSKESLLDSRFSSETPEIGGYVLTMNVGEKTFSCNADPVKKEETGGRHYYIDSSTTVVRMNPSQPASAGDPPFQR